MTGNSSNLGFKNDSLYILGLMSGSSLDGIDLALCSFNQSKEGIQYKVEKTGMVPLNKEWLGRLPSLPSGSALELAHAHSDFGRYLGSICQEFIKGSTVDFIASHGHTLFHYPKTGMTCQIGDGAAIAANSGISTICDFRTMDVAHGGRGAPIVAFFDRYFFSRYAMLLNLGGIANITLNLPDHSLAYDIGPCNQVLNHVASKLGMTFDQNGKIAASANIDKALLKSIQRVEYGLGIGPETLDNTYIKKKYFSILDEASCSFEDQLRTLVEWISQFIRREFLRVKNKVQNNKMMITGGGAHHTFLIEQIKKKCPELEIILPDKQMIDYKEAIMMAFLGYLRIIGRENTLASATGANRNSIGGAVYRIDQDDTYGNN